jgi:hypothetical protein
MAASTWAMAKTASAAPGSAKRRGAMRSPSRSETRLRIMAPGMEAHWTSEDTSPVLAPANPRSNWR